MSTDTCRWDRWAVRPQAGLDAAGKPVPGPPVEVNLCRPVSIDEAREAWQPGPGHLGLFPHARVVSARPIGAPVAAEGVGS